ncbi:MAG: ATP-binding protein [Gemmatimonadales bacterium]
MPLSLSDRNCRFTRWTAGLLGVIGVLVVIGWLTDSELLIRVVPTYPPAQFNAALGLLGLAVSLWGFSHRRRRVMAGGALFAAALGGATLVEYALGADLGIDQLLVRTPDSYTLDAGAPGRMVATTAILLFLSGVVLAAWPLVRPRSRAESVLGTVGMITGAIAGITLFSYASGLLSNLRFGTITGMGIPTVIAFIAVGGTFMACAWESEGLDRGLPAWLPVAAGLAGLCTTAVIWRALTAERDEAARQGIAAEVTTARRLVEARVLAHVQYLSRTARWTAQFNEVTADDWRITLDRLFRDEPDLMSAVWLDTALVERARAFGREPNADYSRMLFLLRGDSSRAVPGQRDRARIILTPGPDPAHPRLSIAMPACTPVACYGHVVGNVDPRTMLASALRALTPGFVTAVSVGNQSLFRSDTVATIGRWRGVDTLQVGQQRWVVEAWPLPSLQRLYDSDMPDVVGILGLGMSALLAATLRFARSSYLSARLAERERLEQALATSTDGVWEYDFLTGQAQAAKRILSRLGYQSPDFAQTDAAKLGAALVHPDDLPRVAKAVDDHLSGRAESFEVETRARAKDGEWHVVVLRGRVIETGLRQEPLRMVGIVADVTDRRRADVALAESETRFRAIFDSAFQFELLLDDEGRCLEANRTFLVATDCSREQVAGRPLAELWWDGDTVRQQRFADAVARARAGETVQYEEEVATAARRLTVDFSVKPVFDADGRVVQLLAEARDVTDRRRAQDALREMDTLSTMGRLAARVAHEINNPLAGVQNSFLLIKDAIPSTHPYFAYVGAIEREIARMASITRQLYETYRPESDGVVDASVTTVVADAVAMLQQVNRQSKATVEVDTTGAPGVVRVPAGLLRQAVYNLVQNAIEASPAGGVVSVRAWQQNGTFALSVTDQGPGVPPDARARIFDPFFSTKNRLSTGGMGLGLALVHRSVTGMGGSVEVEDAPAGGARFVVRLPVGAKAGQPA